MKKVLNWLRDEAAFVWAWYPARTVSVVASVIVFLAARFHVVLPQESVVHAVEIALPVLIGGEVIHHNVTPA